MEQGDAEFDRWLSAYLTEVTHQSESTTSRPASTHIITLSSTDGRLHLQPAT